jgi:hypothetical protein
VTMNEADYRTTAVEPCEWTLCQFLPNWRHHHHPSCYTFYYHHGSHRYHHLFHRREKSPLVRRILPAVKEMMIISVRAVVVVEGVARRAA